MDRSSMNFKDTGPMFLSLKPRLLKSTKSATGPQKNTDAGAWRKNYVSVEFLERNGGNNQNIALGLMDLFD